MYKLQKAAFLHCFVIRLYLSSQPNKHLWMGCSQNAVTITSNSWSSHQIHTKHQSAAVDGKLPHLLAIIHLFLLFILLCQDVSIAQRFYVNWGNNCCIKSESRNSDFWLVRTSRIIEILIPIMARIIEKQVFSYHYGKASWFAKVNLFESVAKYVAGRLIRTSLAPFQGSLITLIAWYSTWVTNNTLYCI